MPQTAKRNAEEAFGRDIVAPSRGKSKKRSKGERREDKEQAQRRKSQNVDQNQTALADSNATDKVSKTNQLATRSLSRSPQILAEESLRRRTENDQHTTADTEVTSTKRKSRSRRNKKPQFDHTNSHIELVLSRKEAEPDEHLDVETERLQRNEIESFSTKPMVSKPSNSLSTVTEKEHKQKHVSERRRRRKEQDTASRKTKLSSAWTVSRPRGGAFINHDLVLTPDEQFLILATKQDIQIYTTQTSLLVRTIHVTKKSEIVTYVQIREQDQFVVVGLTDGTLSKFDWTSGQKVWSASFNGAISSVVSTSSSTANDGFLMVNVSDDGSSNMTSLALDQDGKLLGRRHLLSQKHLLQPICFSATMGILIVCSKNTVFIGQLGENDSDNGASLQWQEISIPDRITCFDAEIKPNPHKQDKPVVNVAVGVSSGEIQLYDDMLGRATSSRKHDLHSRTLHWHRSAPRTVKFSRDSNYLISGGDESVLVIWQLLTNQKQTLPHLTTAILNATVSQQGSSYVLRLGDNSVMVLSTSDLQPFANVSNLAIGTPSSIPFLSGSTVPAVLHPKFPDRLLLAHSSQSLNPSMKPSQKSANMLQTYDIASQIQLSRQALARNLVATVNIGPRGDPLREPDCTHLNITHDGKWLVTVDQWMPGEANMKEMYLSRGDQSSQQQLNECFLRFWSTNTKAEAVTTDVWELNTRIDEPVSVTVPVYGQQILALNVNPSRLEVTVADSNRHLKIYSPKARIRSGVPVRDAAGQQLFTWTCDRDISLQEASVAGPPKSAAVAYSEDGSVVAASWASTVSTNPRVHFINCRSGRVVTSVADIVSSSRCSLAFCSQYLLALSDKFCVYDTITMQQVFAIEVDDRFDRGKSKLAVNTKSGILAVAVSEREVKRPSQLMLLDIHTLDKRPALEEKISSQVHILLADQDSGGFIAVDGDGRSVAIAPPGSVSVALIKTSGVSDKTSDRSKLDNIFGTSEKEAPAMIQAVDSTQQASLESVFNFEQTARAPGTKDLFNRVALVVSGAAA